MKVMAEKIIPSVAEKKVIKCTHAVCDICEKAITIEPPTPYDSECNWAKQAYEVLTTTVEMSQGSRYPEGGDVVHISVQVCPECFDSHLLPFVRSFKSNADSPMFPTKEEFDF